MIECKATTRYDTKTSLHQAPLDAFLRLLYHDSALFLHALLVLVLVMKIVSCMFHLNTTANTTYQEQGEMEMRLDLPIDSSAE
jgi:hypothetical protein